MRPPARPIKRAAIAVVIALATILLTFTARADERPCPPGVERWVARLADDTGADVRAVRCSPGRAVVRLSPPATPPLDVDVAQGGGPSFQRAGPFGLSPLLEVDDFSTLPQGQRDAFAALSRWIVAHPGDVVLDEPPSWTRVAAPHALEGLGGPWLLLAALVLVAASRARAPRLPACDVQLFVVAVGASLALRLLLGAWGPLHINGQAALWILSATTSPVETSAYGPGYPELFGPLARLGGSAPDTVIFATNAILSALAPALAFAVGRLSGLPRSATTIAAAALGVDPVAIHMAPTETYLVPLVALTLGATALGLGAVHHVARGERRRALALALAAGLMLAQAVRIHPSALAPAALAPLTALACAAPLSWSRRFAGALALYAIAAVVIFLTSARALAGVTAHLAAGDIMRPRLSAPPPLSVVMAVALVVAVAGLSRAPWLVPSLAAHLAVLLVGWRNYNQGALWLQASERLYAAVPVVALASCIPAAWLATRAARAAVVAGLLAVLGLWGPHVLLRRTTQDLEYRWTRAWLATLPASCRTLNVSAAGVHRMVLPTYAASPRPPGAFVRVDYRQPIDLGQILGEPRCTYYVRTSLCSTDEGRLACEDVERALDLRPVARTSLLAVADSDYSGFVADPVEIVASRVLAVRR